MILKTFIFVFVFAILFLIKELIEFYKALKTGVKNITEPRLWGIGIALAFIITIIITGFGL